MKFHALVVLSGGQDSTTCLYWALRKFGGSSNVAALTFDYGQRHRVELGAARKIAKIAGIHHEILPIDTFAALGGNALIDRKIEITGENDSPAHLPNTFVPGRNLIFLTFAAAYACQREIHDIVTGVAQTDYSGYPDCRRETIDSLEQTIKLGMSYPVEIHTPLMHKSKAETVKMAADLGALEALAWSHTCYNGEYPPCGSCPACILRRKGFDEAGIPDPLEQRSQR